MLIIIQQVDKIKNITMNETESQYASNEDIHIKIQNCLLKGLKSSENFLDDHTIQKIQLKIEDINSQQTAVEAVQYLIFLLINKLQITIQSSNLDIKAQDYEILEQSVQKAEAEIRKHIRLQQQLKLYMDGLEEKVQELENQLKIQSQKYHQLFQSTKALDMEKRQLKKKLKAAQIRQKTQPQRQTRVLSQKASKILLTESSMYETQNHPYYVPSADKHKLIRRKKSNDKYSQISRSNNQNISQKKLLDNDIQVSLKDSPKKKTSVKQSTQIKDQLTKTVQLKQGYRKHSRKLVRHMTEQSQNKSKKQMRCNSVCQ